MKTVAELIAELSKYPANSIVVARDGYGEQWEGVKILTIKAGFIGIVGNDEYEAGAF